MAPILALGMLDKPPKNTVTWQKDAKNTQMAVVHPVTEVLPTWPGGKPSTLQFFLLKIARLMRFPSADQATGVC